MAMAIPPSVMVLMVASNALQDQDRGEERQGNRRQGNEGRFEVGQEEEHNGHDQDAPIAQGVKDVGHGHFNKVACRRTR